MNKINENNFFEEYLYEIKMYNDRVKKLKKKNKNKKRKNVQSIHP